jgi:hypothetical protein
MGRVLCMVRAEPIEEAVKLFDRIFIRKKSLKTVQ